MNQTKNNSKDLNLVKPLFLLLLFIIGISILFSLLSYFSNIRKQQVYDQYAKETQAYIAANRNALVTVFTDLFPNDICVSTDTFTCPKLSSDTIAKQLPSTLKDWSSTIFLKKGTGEQLLFMRLSADVQRAYLENDEQQKKVVEELLSGKRDIIPWDDYTYELKGKEVIIPVKDQNGKVVGALVRGVIE